MLDLINEHVLPLTLCIFVVTIVNLLIWRIRRLERLLDEMTRWRDESEALHKQRQMTLEWFLGKEEGED